MGRIFEDIMTAFLKKYPFSILVAGLIFYLSIRPTVPDVFYLSESNRIVYQTEARTIDILYFRDFFGHMAFYFLLSCMLLLESWKDGVALYSRKMLLVVVAIPVVYGAVIEFVQEYFFPPRSAEWMDWLSDILGACIAYYLTSKWLTNKYKKV